MKHLHQFLFGMKRSIRVFSKVGFLCCLVSLAVLQSTTVYAQFGSGTESITITEPFANEDFKQCERIFVDANLSGLESGTNYSLELLVAGSLVSTISSPSNGLNTFVYDTDEFTPTGNIAFTVKLTSNLFEITSASVNVDILNSPVVKLISPESNESFNRANNEVIPLEARALNLPANYKVRFLRGGGAGFAFNTQNRKSEDATYTFGFGSQFINGPFPKTVKFTVQVLNTSNNVVANDVVFVTVTDGGTPPGGGNEEDPTINIISPVANETFGRPDVVSITAQVTDLDPDETVRFAFGNINNEFGNPQTANNTLFSFGFATCNINGPFPKQVTFYVKVEDNNGDLVTFEQVTVNIEDDGNCSSIKAGGFGAQSQEVSIFPNQVIGNQLNISFGDRDEEVNFVIRDKTGNPVQTGSLMLSSQDSDLQVELDGRLTSGIYFIEVLYRGEVIQKRFIKQ